MRRVARAIGLTGMAAALGLGALGAPWLLLPASHDRDWQPVYGRVAQVVPLTDGRVRV